MTELPQGLVFVDLETTGGNSAHHRITEVGIVRMDADQVIEEWSSLVNPECRIPAYIEAFTGITNDMVADAPRFADIAALVLEKLQTSGRFSSAPVFVAHNARFDYSFLRTEFRRLNMQYSASVLCTVKLSRRLFPEYPRHNLDAVMERHRLTCTGRHRALGDARVISDFWRKLRGDIGEGELAAATQIIIGANQLPPHLPPGLAEELPEGPGVYRLFGEDNLLLYIGRSHSLRARVLGHFAAAPAQGKEQTKARQTRRIDWTETAGELGAQLKEAEWIKDQRPLYNKRVKSQADSFTLRALEHSRGVQLAAIGDLSCTDLAECYGVFHSQKDGRKALIDIARAHSLCLSALGLEDGPEDASCVGYQVGKCKGACVGKEPLALHDARLRMALSSLKLKPWPFPGRVAVQEGCPSAAAGEDGFREGRCEYHVLDHWVYLGTAQSEEELAGLASKRASAAFDAQVYRIVVRYLAKNPKMVWHDLRDSAIGT